MSSFADFSEKILVQPVSVRLRNSFLDYGMSVITSRALPDVRDGLKPVHRRTLYAMFTEGFTADKKYQKSAKTVGIVIGNYHPHGDSSVYDSMVRLSQKWIMKEILVDMHGNNGSVDGDAPAAMRYTESKLSKIAMEMLRDINKDTVDFVGNFDDSEVEPTVLPSRFPQILVNGTSGIAVGMATSIPSHNLKEVCEAVISLIDNPNMTVADLMEYIKGPDFPTRGIIMGQENIKRAYETGRTGKGGSIKLRAKIDVVEEKGKTFLHITELPYQVFKDKVLEKLNELQLEHNRVVKERKTSTKKIVEDAGFDFAVPNGIVDATEKHHVGKNQVLIRIELKDGVIPQQVINGLYKKTELEKSIPVNLLALVPEGKTGTVPKTLNLKEILEYYLQHQLEVVERSHRYDLKKNESKLQSLSALMKALNNLDETIATIKSATSTQDAKEKLQVLLDIDEKQAISVLDRRLQTLASYEQDSLRKEYNDILSIVEEIKGILADENKIKNIVKEDLQVMIDKYGTERLTTIGEAVEDIDDESLIPNHEVVVTITNKLLIKRTLDSTYRTQRRKGRGVNGMDMRDDDFIRHLCYARNHDTILFFTNKGKVYETKVYRIMEAAANSRGYSIKTMFNFEEDEQIQAVLNIQDFSDEQYLLFATKNGIVKKSRLSEYENIRVNGIKAINLDTDKKTGEIVDRLIGVSLTSGESLITLVTQKGQSITFKEEEVSTIGRTGRGVKGITLAKDDAVISVGIHNGVDDLFVATDKGFGKRTPLSEFGPQARGGKGKAAIRLTGKNGTSVIGCDIVAEEETIMLITKNEGKIMKLAVKEIGQYQRNTQGNKIINLYEGDSLQQVARVTDAEEEESEE